ncbi:23S rRNA (pseudouridine(1915)-N(3))-methyltransferase RlmH [uncultured Kiloniella sp.]|uniref:23S rRNA (pseudouridine(1915)-N(3))-methyltransferase RlmH n=1 Tax=uncultured Kiloniella sp. TaxID=1133091 RepID=UPI002637CE7C|nr:23S rRNA (pseudouridine(1915)-N(3))-methyltransferase RlmH [uncultured Kiloniella sp.]
MRITLIAVGKAKASPARDLFELYCNRLRGNRLNWSLDLKEVEEKKNLPASQLKEREGELLLAAAPKGAKIVILDEKGKDLSSPQFSKLLEKWQDGGDQDIAFLIGGADGLSDTVKEKSQQSLCFGRLTWPHMLVRGLFAEQVYRASCILSGHPYHRD